jgi:nicotinate-nucleotide adenylyltransferase
MVRCGVDDLSNPQRLGLFGGTFDPVHNGHLAVAGRVQEAFGLDNLWFIPAPVPPHKPGHIDNRDISSFADRAAMLELALDDHKGFTLSCLENELPTPSYTVDTLQEIRKRLGLEVQLYFIIGVDAFVEIDTWKDYLQLPALANFVVISRPAYQLDRVYEIISRCYTNYCHEPQSSVWEPQGQGKKIHLLAMEPVVISSTEIRRRIAEGQAIDNYVPAPVAAYIREHGLYRT